MDPIDRRAGRAARLAAYNDLREERPELFVNPPGAASEILFDPADQEEVADQAAEWARANGIPEENSGIGVAYRDPWMMVVRDPVRFRSGAKSAYVRALPAVLGIAAAVMPVLEDDSIVVVRHFRHSDRRWHWEIPRGFAEPGSDGAATARRELKEELGCGVGELVRLGEMQSDSGASAGDDAIYWGRVQRAELETAIGADAVAEGIDEVRIVDAGQLRKMMVEGELTDSYTLAAIAFATALGLLRTFPDSNIP